MFSCRKDTEALVHHVILDNQFQKDKTFVDLGTGTGCISVALACNLDKSNKFIGFEKSPYAFNNSLENKELYQLDNLEIINQDYLELMENNSFIDFDVLVCNPPYISRDYKLDDNVINYDPESALFANDNGLEYYDKILNYLVRNEIKNVSCYFEIGFDQKEPLEKKLENLGIKSYNFIVDNFAIPRILKICL